MGPIRALSYLDNGNLDRLDDGPGRDKQQQRDDLRKRVVTSPELPRLNKDIQNRIYVRLGFHNWQKWGDFVETMDQRTELTKLWRTRAIDG